MPRLPFSFTRRPNSENVISRTRVVVAGGPSMSRKKLPIESASSASRLVRGALVGVGVEAVEADVEDARAEAPGDQARRSVAASG